jgi:oligoribonuclease (3'-5' exoribonuclease)
MNEVGQDIAAQDHLLLWFDLETTGLDEHKDVILEIGWGITGLDLEWIMDPKSYLIENHLGFTTDPFGVMLITDAGHRYLNDFIVNMHAKSGLWADWQEEPLLSLTYAEQTILSVLNINPDAKVTMAGSGVAQFDFRWIAHYMPLLHARLTYYQIDTGAAERVDTLLTTGEIRSSRGAADHRSVPDILFSHDWAIRKRYFLRTGQHMAGPLPTTGTS